MKVRDLKEQLQELTKQPELERLLNIELQVSLRPGEHDSSWIVFRGDEMWWCEYWKPGWVHKPHKLSLEYEIQGNETWFLLCKETTIPFYKQKTIP